MSRPPVKQEIPTLHPYICASCMVGEITGRKYFIDTGLSYDYEGVVYICDKCLEDIIKVSGDYISLTDMYAKEDRILEVVNSSYASMTRKKAFYEYALTLGLDLQKLEDKYTKTTEMVEYLNGADGVFTEFSNESDEGNRIPNKSDPDSVRESETTVLTFNL